MVYLVPIIIPFVTKNNHPLFNGKNKQPRPIPDRQKHSKTDLNSIFLKPNALYSNYSERQNRPTMKTWAYQREVEESRIYYSSSRA